MARSRLALAIIDATIWLFSPKHKSGYHPAETAHRRTWYFAHNELSRLIMDALRHSFGPIAAGDFAAIVQAKGQAGDVAMAANAATPQAQPR